MRSHPSLRTDRLVLREFAAEDASAVGRVVGEWGVARMMRRIPHPYEDGWAEEWIAGCRPAFEAGERVSFAVVLREGGALVGSIALHLDARDNSGELGYWVGRPYWGRGYATEAARAVVRYGFEELGLRRVRANHIVGNPASGRVLRKVGMSHEGTRPEHHEKSGTYEGRVEYGLLARDWREINRR